MTRPILISAVGTPLTSTESLHVEGLDAHLAEQWRHGIDGVLVAGSMGLMQLLTDSVYAELARRSVEVSAGRGELLIGAGDCSFARTRDRIALLNELKVDGVVVLTPYFVRFSQQELTGYYRSLADFSRAPLYLYDLPQRTGSKIELKTVIELSQHPNIRGIKCSDEPSYARELRDALGDRFRVVIAQSALLDTFLRGGFMEHLDGMYALAPRWTVGIAKDVLSGELDAAAVGQRQLNELRGVLLRYGIFQAMTAILNARGVPGNLAPQPSQRLNKAQQEQVLAEPVVQALLKADA